MGTINILFCFDLNYYEKAITTISQMLSVTNPANFYNIYIIIDKIPSFSFNELIEKVYKIKNYKILFRLQNHDFDNINSHKWSSVVFWRLQVPSLIPEDKILSFDVDIVFREDPAILFSNEISTHIAGVIDLMSVEYLEYDKNKQYFSDIGKEKAVNYINGGCILFNNKKIIRDRLYEKFLQEAKNNYALNEQHILNLVCSKTILDFIFSSFNNRVWYLRKKIFPHYAKNKKELKEKMNNVFYVHFNRPKQWSYKWCFFNRDLKNEWNDLYKKIFN